MEESFSKEAILARLRGIPAERALGYRVEEMSPGHVVMVAPYDPTFAGIYQSFHGGLLATLADSAGGTAALTLIGAEAATATTELTVRFLAPCRTDARATARVIKCGRTIVISEINIHDMNGEHCAVCHASYIRLRRKESRQDGK